MKQVILIASDFFQSVSWKNDDIETLKISTFSDFTEKVPEANNFEEYIYRNPGLLESNVETIIVFENQTFLLPENCSVERTRKLLNFAFDELSDLSWLHDDNIHGTNIWFKISTQLNNFLLRSFHPVKIHSALYFQIKKWNKIFESLNDPTEKLCFDIDDKHVYIIAFDQANNIKMAQHIRFDTLGDNQEYFIIKLIRSVFEKQRGFKVYYDDTPNTLINEIINKIHIDYVELIKISIVPEKSFDVYIYDNQQINPVLKNVIYVTNEFE